MSDIFDFYQEIGALRIQGIAMVVITVASARGSTPADAGAKALVTQSGLYAGTVGGGKIEARAIERAQEKLNELAFINELITWNLQQDIGMTCGGEMTLLFEKIEPTSEVDWQIVLFGAGHVSAALVRILSDLPCRVDLIDPRLEWLAKIPNYPNVTKHQPDHYQDRVDLITESSQVLCISQGHATDRPVLAAIFEKNLQPSFLGAIGSASKRATLHRELREDGHSQEVIDQITCPIGLPIGDNSPPQIALSIAAQLLEKRGG